MAEQKKEQAVDTKQLLKVRREKLAELQANGQNPFEITKYDVTSHSAEIKDNFEKLEVTECADCRAYDVKTCHGKGLLLQRAGSSGEYPVPMWHVTA